MIDTGVLLESVVLWCLPDYEVTTAVATSYAADGFSWTFEPLPTTVSAVQSYLRCLDRRRPVPMTLERSWESFYQQYHPLVKWVVGKFCCQVEQDDLSQDVWLELVVELPKLNNGCIRGNFSSWLAGLTRRKVGRTIHQKKALGAKRFLPLEDFKLASSDLGPDDEYLLKETLNQLDEALDKLRRQTSQVNYELFCRKFITDQSAKEIADALDLTPNEVRCRYRRLKRKWQLLTKGFGANAWNSHFAQTANSPPPSRPR